jgi:hypothetical protein
MKAFLENAKNTLNNVAEHRMSQVIEFLWITRPEKDR